MGSFIELNDTLQITAEQGFPDRQLSLERHAKKPYRTEDFKGKIFEFKNKPGARLYHPAPCRCFLVQNRGGKWLYWGKIEMIEQTIKSDRKQQTTSGKYKIIRIYDPEYQKQITRNESPEGLSYY
jgi:hypothetical protein